MAEGQVNFFNDGVDDVLLPDQVPSFEGGQFSNVRANLLQQNQSKQLLNCDVDKLGKIRTRRGTVIVGKDGGAGPQPDPGVTSIIQGLTSYQTADYNYIVAAHNRKIWKYTGDTTAPHTSGWEQIAKGGTVDNEDIIICRQGLVNHSGGYLMGDTVIEVDGLPAVAAPLLAAGEKLYFVDNLRTNYYEYTIKSWDAVGPPVNQITLEEPGLVFDVKDNWRFIVARPAKVNNAAGYPGGTSTIAIDGYNGEVFNTERFVIKSENITHSISAHSGGPPTTGITFSPVLIGDYVASNATDPIVFAQGNDSLFFSDGVNNIYAWNGKTLMSIASHSILDDLQGTVYSKARTAPPVGPKVLLWFQNRLIASGISAEPDAIYFSDFFDASAWDADYQKVRIGGGESDPITGLVAWTDYNMLVFKKNSCYLINLDPSQNPVPDDPTLLTASFAVKQLHKLIGCPAPQSAVQVGGGSTTPGSDVFFLDGDKKVHSIRRVIAAETQQEVGQAMSLPIQDVLDTINIQKINLACAIYHNEHYILGFPSMRGTGGGILYNNNCVAYNMLTQSWCGTWDWAPTCFARRTDLGDYSKLILGDYRTTPAGGGRVLQWMDDLGLDEETDTTYQDLVPNAGNGIAIATQIMTRAFTGGDMYSYKTGLSVEFEFDESVADAVKVKVFRDKILHHANGLDTIAPPFSTLTELPVRLTGTGPVIPFTLPNTSSFIRFAFDVQRYGTWRELQFQISATSKKLALRSIRLTFFMDTLTLQTEPTT